MNLFERINHRFNRSNSPSIHSQNETQNTSGQSQRYVDQAAVSRNVQSHIPSLQKTSAADYDCSDMWTDQQHEETHQISNRSLSASDKASRNHSLNRKGTKTPLSSLYNVSSDEEDEDADDGDDQIEGSDYDQNRDHDESPAQFIRRSLRIRRSQEKAKAALPPDFADRIEVAPTMSDSVYQDVSATLTEKSRYGRDGPDMLEETTEFRASGSEEEDDLTRSNAARSNDSKVNDRRSGSTLQSGWPTSNEMEGPDIVNEEQRYEADYDGIHWSLDEPQSLEDLMPYFRSKPSGTTYLLKAIAQRPGCRCALCGHESLLLFPVMESSVALAQWGSWTSVVKTHGRLSHHSRHTNHPTITTEIHSHLVLFRQCRGWYEILNESFQPIPHLVTVEQMRRSKPSTFLIRRDLRCLLAPSSLTIPSFKDIRQVGDEPPPVPFPSSVIATATSPLTLMSSVPEILPAGTLMRFVSYLPRCTVKRGRKTKELGLILAALRWPDNTSAYQRSDDIESNGVASRAYYIGLEDSTPAVFPPKFSISPVAGPENISGVHSLASILRKFRLPLTIKPVILSDGGTKRENGTSETRFQHGASTSSNGLACGLSAVPGLSFCEQNFLRLESLRRSDLLIISPTATPERLYLVTPSMLPDHVFQIGESQNPTYLKLLDNHRVQSVNFLAVAHPKESLSYLIRHMREVTREPRESYTHRRNKSTVAQPQLEPTETYQIYDELDDIYFYIRHGYYPSKSRLSDAPLKSETTRYITKASTEIPGNSNEGGASMKKGSIENSQYSRSGAVPKAEALLAASLATPVRNLSFKQNTPNGAGKTSMPNYRSQSREQGI